MTESKHELASKYIIKDIESLLEWDELPENAGPLFHVVLHGISSLSRIYFGFNRPKRSFAKFATKYMQIPSELADLLYGCMKSMQRNGAWLPCVAITTARREEKQESSIFYRASDNIIIIDIVELAKSFLAAIDRVPETSRLYKLPHPVKGWQHIEDEARKAIWLIDPKLEGRWHENTEAYHSHITWRDGKAVLIS